MNRDMQKKFLHLMESGMAPALGCTDPVGIALCAAAARKNMPGDILKVEAVFLPSLLKNVAAVTIPKTENLCGARMATALGIIGGNADKGLEVLEDITSDDIEMACELEQSDKIMINVAEGAHRLYMNIKITTSEGTGEATIENEYANITSIKVNGTEQFEAKETVKAAAAVDEETFALLSIESIIDFVEFVSIEELSRVKEGIEMNRCRKITAKRLFCRARHYGRQQVLMQEWRDVRFLL